MTQTFPIEVLKTKATPYYYYDTAILRQTLDAVKAEVSKHDNYYVHYAIKANANDIVLKPILDAGLGIDCVSGGEIEVSLKAGFPADKIVFAGVGKADWEIELGIDNNILCFNVESIPELEVINTIAQQKGKVVNICLRINPNVGAHTHANITTGLSENKFGIDMAHMLDVIKMTKEMSNVSFQGLHFHIGSQILEMDDFIALCQRVNELQDQLEREGIKVKIINVGGGLGVDYENPLGNPIPDLKKFFNVYDTHLKLREGQELHFELGRAIVAQCGFLITKVLYMKDNTDKKFAIVDAGFTELIRPALYGAHHKIMNITSDGPLDTYDVVGPICESSDTFDTDIQLNQVKRGDLIAILSAGAYGESMASCYNCRKLPQSYSSEDIMAE